MKRIKMFKTSQQAETHIETLTGKGQAWNCSLHTEWYKGAHESRYGVEFNGSGWFIWNVLGEGVVTE